MPDVCPPARLPARAPRSERLPATQPPVGSARSAGLTDPVILPPARSARGPAVAGRAPTARAPAGRAPVGCAPAGRAPAGRAPACGQARPGGARPGGRAPAGRTSAGGLVFGRLDTNLYIFSICT